MGRAKQCGVGVVVYAAALLCAGCGGRALPESATVGPDPTLPAPREQIIPTVGIALPDGWDEGETPKPADGLAVNAFAAGLEHPRWLHVLPNGDVLVAETNAPRQPEDGQGLLNEIFGFFQGLVTGAGGSANRITLLRDADGNGAAELRTAFLTGLNSPLGMALVGDSFYVANADGLVRFPYVQGETQISATASKVVDLPAGTHNRHWTKSLIASQDGSKLYIGVGSNSDHAEGGMADEEGRAAIWEVDVATGAKRIYAGGLRNPVGMTWEPETGVLWTAVNERDALGNDLVPDYMTSVRDGGFYGWPYSYFGQNVDSRVKPQNPELVARAIVPDYALGAHTASLGLAYSESNALSPTFQRGMFVGQHGSWNRKPRSGYKVIFVPFANGIPAGQPTDVLTGFLAGNKAKGRPVGVAVDKQGALLVADDVGNVIWRVRAD